MEVANMERERAWRSGGRERQERKVIRTIKMQQGGNGERRKGPTRSQPNKKIGEGTIKKETAIGMEERKTKAVERKTKAVGIEVTNIQEATPKRKEKEREKRTRILEM